MTARVPSVGRRPLDATDPINGYQVITIDGIRVGSVVAVQNREITIRCGTWPFQRLRALPVELAVVRDIDRTVLMLTSPDDLARVLEQNLQLTSERSRAAARHRAQARRTPPPHEPSV